MSRQHTKLLFLLVLGVFDSLITISEALEVRACSSKKALPLGVTVDGCDKEPCKVVNKKKIHFAIDFEARK